MKSIPLISLVFGFRFLLKMWAVQKLPGEITAWWKLWDGKTRIVLVEIKSSSECLRIHLLKRMIAQVSSFQLYSQYATYIKTPTQTKHSNLSLIVCFTVVQNSLPPPWLDKNPVYFTCKQKTSFHFNVRHICS